MRRILFATLALLALLVVPTASAQTDSRCFPETGFCISGRIRTFWEQNGGLPVFGFPVGPQQEQQIEGKPFQAQWFERNRLELHPENARPYDVLLGRLGADRLAQQGRPDWQNFPKAQPQGDCLSFETGYSVCGPILAAWHASGLEFDGKPGTSYAESLALFGLPLSSPEQEVLEGQVYTVQYFERARFELHAENAPPYNVLLGLLGNEIRQNAPVAQVSSGAEIDNMTAAGSQMFFSARDADHGGELWASDGTADGTRLVKDILPGSESSFPHDLVALNDALLFAARTKVEGSDSLWRSDGTAAGTVELVPGAKLHDIQQLTVVGDRVFFIADDGVHGNELWVTDGTGLGTHLVKDIYPGARGIDPEQNMPMGYTRFTLTAVGPAIYFQAETPGQRYGIWKSDGTADGTQFVTDLNTGDAGAEYWDLTSMDNTLLFIGRTSRLNYGLYRTNDTPATTQLLHDFSYTSDPGALRLYPPISGLTLIGDQVYFNFSGLLWKTDGTTERTTQVTQLPTGDVAGLGTQAYFLTRSQTAAPDLVQARQTLDEQVVATIAPTLSQSGGQLASAGRHLFIAVNGSGGRAELWVSDGSAVGTRPLLAVKGKLFGQADGLNAMRPAAALGERLFFIADDGIHGGELWVSDGTPAGTVMVKDINMGQA